MRLNVLMKWSKRINNGPPLFLIKKACIYFKGCDSNFEVIIFQILKVASNETTTLH